MTSKREESIDLMRGIGILLMILIHTTSYFLSHRLVFAIWDYSHFVVSIFIFCSAFILFERKKDSKFTLSAFVKRIKRLLFPFYLYLLFYYVYLFFFQGNLVSLKSIISQVFLLNFASQDFDWLVFLFILFVPIMELIKLIGKKRIYLYCALAISVLASVALLFYKPQIPFRLIMWLPWSLVAILVKFMIDSSDRKKFAIWTLLFSTILLFATNVYLATIGKSVVMINNKYPPNLYHLSYGVTMTFLLYLIFQNITFPGVINKFIQYFSLHSYSIFFIHFLLIKILRDNMNINVFGPWGFFGVVLISSSIMQMVLNYLLKIAFPKTR